MDDYVHAVHHLMMHTEADGPFNITAPKPRASAHLRQSARTCPSTPILRASVRDLWSVSCSGKWEQELILEGQHVEPRRLQDLGFRFEHPELERPRHTLGKVRTPSEDTMHTRR